MPSARLKSVTTALREVLRHGHSAEAVGDPARPSGSILPVRAVGNEVLGPALAELPMTACISKSDKGALWIWRQRLRITAGRCQLKTGKLRNRCIAATVFGEREDDNGPSFCLRCSRHSLEHHLA
ncbi:MAG: hypothetical protein JWO08_714 [Verrucomicrobiaceae bacterium]|nr:hypothetical protein [Verrucomicrobiaceae bacterium]